MDLAKLRMADWVVVGGTLLYLVLATLPWWDYGFFSLSGFQGSGAVSSAFVLFLLAAAWAVLPAFSDLRVGFPRAWVTVGLAALGFLLTLVAWTQTFEAGFSLWALLGLLTAAAILLFTLLPQLRDRPALPGALAGAAQWANQPAPGPSAGSRSAGPPPAPPVTPVPPPPGPSATGTATPPTAPLTTPMSTSQGVPPPPPPGGPEPPEEDPPRA